MNEQRPMKLMTIKEAAKTGIMPENTLRRPCKADKVPCIKIGCRTLICYDALVDYLKSISSKNGV